MGDLIAHSPGIDIAMNMNPLTFLAGVYGMNSHYIPELNQPIAYPAFWVVCVLLALLMLLLFRKRAWI